MVSIYELKLGAEKLEILKALSAEIEKAIASIGKIDNSRLNAIYNDILEKANRVLQDKNLVQELKDKVDVAHKDISEKAATINQKFEQQQALLQSMQKLKEEIEALLKSGVIDDAAEKTTTTYSSKKIGDLLKLKTDKADFDDLKNTVDDKLGKDEQAADSAKLGGTAADKYMKSDKYNPTAASSPNTLVLRDANGDFKGGRITAGNFLTTEKAQDSALDEHSEICYRAAQGSEADPKHMRFATLKKMKSMLKGQAATETEAGIVKLKNSITGSLSDTAVSEKAAKEYMDKNASIGVGQTWQEVTSERHTGVTYTNTTGRPIFISVYMNSNAQGGSSAIEIFVDDKFIGGQYAGRMSGLTTFLSACAIVPFGSTYSAKTTRALDGSYQDASRWLELR